MARRKPLVLNGANTEQVQSADTLSRVPIITTDTYANRPSSNIEEGDIHLPSDGASLMRLGVNAAAWGFFGPLFKFTEPPNTQSNTTLSGGINNSTTSITVASSSGFSISAGPFLAQIDSEIFKVTAISGTTWTVTRGYDGSSAASHSNGATVQSVPWTWTNQGSASVDTTNGGIYLSCASNSSSHSMRLRKRLAPTPPYTIVAAVIPLYTISTYGFWSVGWREASSGKLVAPMWYGGGAGTEPAMTIYQWSSATALGSAEFNSSSVIQRPTVVWVKLEDDNTNRKVHVSLDGQHWFMAASASRTAYGTPDQIFFGVDPYSQAMGMWLVSWKEN